jgi:hypothetical protein
MPLSPKRSQVRGRSRDKSDRGPEEQPVRVAALRSRAGALAGDVEILDVQAQHLVGACRRLVQQPPQRALAQREVATFPRPLEARQRDAARLVVLLRTPVQDDVAVDVQQPVALAAAREGPDRRQMPIPRRRRRVTTALREHTADRRARHRRRRELDLEHCERLAVLRPRRHGEVRLRQKRVDRRRKSTVSLCRFDEAQGGAAAGGHRHRRRFYSAGQRGASGRQRRLRRKRVVFAHGQLGAPPLMRAAGPDDRWRPDAGLRGEWALPRALATLQRWAAVGPLDLGRRVFSSRAAAARSRRRRRVTACAWSFSRLCRSRSPPGSPQVDQR